MNIFNCFQAMAFYTLLPFLIQWLFANQHQTWGWFAAVVQVIGYVIVSLTVYDRSRNRG